MNELKPEINQQLKEVNPNESELNILAADIRSNLRRLILENIETANRLLTLIMFLINNHHDNEIVNEIQAQYQKDLDKLEEKEVVYIQSLTLKFKRFRVELEFKSE